MADNTIDFNNLEEMLRDGHTPEDIADYFTRNLNAAIKTTAKNNQVMDICVDLADSWNDLVDNWAESHKFPDGVDKEEMYMTPEIAGELFNQIMDIFTLCAPIYKSWRDTISAPVMNNTVSKSDADEFSATVDKFLNMMK